MMTSVVDITGKPIDGEISEITPLSVLKELVADIEDGKLSPERIYILLEYPDPHFMGRVLRSTRDNGLTVSEAVYLLEMEKATVLRMMMDADHR